MREGTRVVISELKASPEHPELSALLAIRGETPGTATEA